MNVDSSVILKALADRARMYQERIGWFRSTSDQVLVFAKAKQDVGGFGPEDPRMTARALRETAGELERLDEINNLIDMVARLAATAARGKAPEAPAEIGGRA